MKNSETVSVFQFNNFVFNANLKDISHAESLTAPGTGGNSINWIVGHLLVNRDDAREMVGLARIYTGAEYDVYKRGSKELNPSHAVDFSKLFAGYNDNQKELEVKISETDFSKKPDELRTMTSLAFHEAYHIGQTGLLRRIAGKEGAIK